MNLITVQASPRLDGNTATLVGWVENAWQRRGHQSRRIELAGLQIGGCRSCYACAESPAEPGCVLQDDAIGIFDRLIGASAILFATPLYMWSYAAQLKALLDRSLCLARGYATADHRSFVAGKPAALLVSCGGPIDNNADAIALSFPRLANYLKLDSRGVWVFPLCTDTAHLPDTHRQKAVDLADSLIA